MAKKPTRGKLIKQFKSAYIRQMEGQVASLKERIKALQDDPNSVIGKFLDEFNSVVLQNNRLSAVACMGIEEAGGVLVVPVEHLDQFTGKRVTVNLKKKTDENGKETLIFTYDVKPTEPNRVESHSPTPETTPMANDQPVNQLINQPVNQSVGADEVSGLTHTEDASTN